MTSGTISASSQRSVGVGSRTHTNARSADASPTTTAPDGSVSDCTRSNICRGVAAVSAACSLYPNYVCVRFPDRFEPRSLACLGLRQGPEWGNAFGCLLTTPPSVGEPQRMIRVMRARWPGSVHEGVMKVLLDVINDLPHVPSGIVSVHSTASGRFDDFFIMSRARWWPRRPREAAK
jgi:hypothetical protein